MARKKSRVASLARRADLLWAATDRPRRGPKPGLSVDHIVQAAVAIADKDGLRAVTMQRVAQHLGVTTMALYRYVAGKSELVDGMLEAVVGPPPGMDTARDWRTKLEIWARANLAIFQRHPWALHAILTTPPLGPSRLAWFESALTALSGAGMSPAETIATVSLVDDQVRGAAQLELALAMTPEFGAGWARAVERAVADDRFPTLTALAAAGAFGSGGDTSWDHFAFGLKRVLDGVESYVRARKGKSDR